MNIEVLRRIYPVAAQYFPPDPLFLGAIEFSPIGVAPKLGATSDVRGWNQVTNSSRDSQAN